MEMFFLGLGSGLAIAIAYAIPANRTIREFAAQNNQLFDRLMSLDINVFRTHHPSPELPENEPEEEPLYEFDDTGLIRSHKPLVPEEVE